MFKPFDDYDYPVNQDADHIFNAHDAYLINSMLVNDVDDDYIDDTLLGYDDYDDTQYDMKF